MQFYPYKTGGGVGFSYDEGGGARFGVVYTR